MSQIRKKQCFCKNIGSDLRVLTFTFASPYFHRTTDSQIFTDRIGFLLANFLEQIFGQRVASILIGKNHTFRHCRKSESGDFFQDGSESVMRLLGSGGRVRGSLEEMSPFKILKTECRRPIRVIAFLENARNLMGEGGPGRAGSGQARSGGVEWSRVGSHEVGWGGIG